MAISDEGNAYAAGGLHARLRDLTRFGQIYTQPESFSLLSTSMIEKIQSSGLQLSPTTKEKGALVFGPDLPRADSIYLQSYPAAEK